MCLIRMELVGFEPTSVFFELQVLHVYSILNKPFKIDRKKFQVVNSSSFNILNLRIRSAKYDLYFKLLILNSNKEKNLKLE